MHKIIIKFSLFIFMLLPLNCGFKVLHKSESNNFSIQKIITSGDKRISYKIKNNLLVYSKENKPNELVLYINTKKNKSIKEKNIKNEITKYKINLNIKVSFNLIGSTNEKEEINFNIEGDYSVNQFHSTTIANEKKLIDNLVKNISEKISNEIRIKINDI